MKDLFDIPESKSPQLKWIEKHGITTHYSADLCDGEHLPWIAWDKANDDGEGTPDNQDACGYGYTENEALLDLLVTRGLEHWHKAV